MLRAFDRQVAVPAILNDTELSEALQGADFFDQRQAAKLIGKVKSDYNLEPHHELRVNLGIKQVLKLARQSQVVGGGDGQIVWFAEKLVELIAGANA